MSETPLADSIQKLKEAHPDAPAWILNRAEIIADQRLEQASREAFIKGASTVLSTSFWRGAALGMGAMLNIFDRPDFTQARRDARKNSISGPNSIGKNFEWAFENMRLATCDYITTHDVPLDMFTKAEQRHLFPNGLPTKDHSTQPDAAL